MSGRLPCQVGLATCLWIKTTCQMFGHLRDVKFRLKSFLERNILPTNHLAMFSWTPAAMVEALASNRDEPAWLNQHDLQVGPLLYRNQLAPQSAGPHPEQVHGSKHGNNHADPDGSYGSSVGNEFDWVLQELNPDTCSHPQGLRTYGAAGHSDRICNFSQSSPKLVLRPKRLWEYQRARQRPKPRLRPHQVLSTQSSGWAPFLPSSQDSSWAPHLSQNSSLHPQLIRQPGCQKRLLGSVRSLRRIWMVEQWSTQSTTTWFRAIAACGVTKWTLVEIYGGHANITARAMECGLKALQPVDKIHGVNLMTREDHQWSPFLTVIEPICKLWSPLTNLTDY